MPLMRFLDRVDEETKSSTPMDNGFGLQKLTDYQFTDTGKEMMPGTKPFPAI